MLGMMLSMFSMYFIWVLFLICIGLIKSMPRFTMSVHRVRVLIITYTLLVFASAVYYAVLVKGDLLMIDNAMGGPQAPLILFCIAPFLVSIGICHTTCDIAPPELKLKSLLLFIIIWIMAFALLYSLIQLSSDSEAEMGYLSLLAITPPFSFLAFLINLVQFAIYRD